MKSISFLAIIFLLLACSKPNQALRDGFWTFQVFQDKNTGDFETDTLRHHQIVLSFTKSGDCNLTSIFNNCSGSYKIYNGIKIENLACTKMASVDSLDNVLENRFIEALTNAQTFHIIDSVLKIQYKNQTDHMNELVFSKNDCAC